MPINSDLDSTRLDNHKILKPITAFSKKNLLGDSLFELENQLLQWKLPKFRAKQLYHWIYKKGAKDFSTMKNLGQITQNFLAKKAIIYRPKIARKLIAKDDTKKWLLNFENLEYQQHIHQVSNYPMAEMVFIPKHQKHDFFDPREVNDNLINFETDVHEGTLCISSQIGCTLNCSFCHTGTQALVRNLTVAEILGQVMLAKDELNDWRGDGQWQRRLNNIVFMGMGEPLYNTDNVIAAILLLEQALQISKRKITVSTSGIAPEIHALGLATGVNLAISLHAVHDDLRNELVPINKKYPLKELLTAAKNYPAIYHADKKYQHGDFQGRRITWQYVMLRGINDSQTDAKELVRLIKGIPSKVNLIPFNPWAGCSYETSDDATIENFANIIRSSGYAVPVRQPRGRDILAACGQLRSDSLKKRRNEQQI